MLVGVHGRKDAIERGEPERTGYATHPSRERIRADRRVARERRDGADMRVALRAVVEAVEPVVRDFGIAVEQDHVAVRVQRHAAIDRLDEAEIAVVAQERDTPRGGELVQVACDFQLGCRVVDDDRLECVRRPVSEQAGEAAPRRGEARMDGNDDVDHDRVVSAAAAAGAQSRASPRAGTSGRASLAAACRRAERASAATGASLRRPTRGTAAAMPC